MPIDIKIVENPQKTLAIQPKKFGMWLFLVSVTMLFASLTSAYIVRQAEGNWNYFGLPMVLYFTTAVILMSSASMQWAYWSAKKNRYDHVKIGLMGTAVLGILFLAGQFYGWGELVDKGVYLVGNPSGSFLYILTGLHGLHLISAIIVLAINIISVYRFNAETQNLAQMEMCTTYWHFLGGLWLYLFIFLVLN